jgi:hypothetical protein
MRITIDSTEPLDAVLPVIGAMYNVTLRTEERDAVTPSATRGRVGGTSRARGTTARRRKPAAAPPAAVRAWARSNGITVNERGRVSADVLAAYHAAT